MEKTIDSLPIEFRNSKTWNRIKNLRWGGNHKEADRLWDEMVSGKYAGFAQCLNAPRSTYEVKEKLKAVAIHLELSINGVYNELALIKPSKGLWQQIYGRAFRPPFKG